MPEVRKKRATKKANSPETTIKKGEKLRLGKKLTDEEKLIRKEGKYKILSDMHELLFTDKHDLHDVANDQLETPIRRGLAKMGLRIVAEGPLREIEMVMNIYGISTKNTTTEANVSGTYADFLAEKAEQAKGK